MSQSERCDGRQYSPATRHQQDHSENEGKMIEPGQDVLDAQSEVSGNSQCAGLGEVDRELGIDRFDDSLDLMAVRKLDIDQRIRERAFQSRNFQGGAVKGCAVNLSVIPAADHEAVR